MNIFAVDNDPRIAATNLVDKHVVKMILETAQLLCTAHRVLDGTHYTGKTKNGRNIKRWRMEDPQDDMRLYQATHVNHPSAAWARACGGNYQWLYHHFQSLLLEYNHRYGKYHKCMDLWDHLSLSPRNIPKGHVQEFAVAMPDEYKVSGDPVQSYRNYYKHGKAHLHKWTNREMPEWMK